MDQDKIKSLLQGIGVLAEVALASRRAAINAGASEKEADVITQSVVKAILTAFQ